MRRRARSVSRSKVRISGGQRPRKPRIQRDDYGDDWKEVCAQVKRRDNYTCQGKNCGCTDRSQLQVHHIRPLSRGGRTVATNLLTLCERCHSKRHRHLH